MNWFFELENSILLFFQDVVRQDGLNGLFKGLSWLGNMGGIWIVTSVTLLFSKKTRKVGLVALVALGFCFIINNLVIKNLVARPRPYTQIPELNILVNKLKDYSFPSGHACSSFAAATIYRRMLGKTWGRPALLLAALIALSRLYVGVHYPSDVIVGIIVGVLGSSLIYRLYKARFNTINEDKYSFYD